MRIISTIVFLTFCSFKTFSQILVLPDTANPDLLMNLKVRAYYEYVDTVLDMEHHFDRLGRKTLQRCYGGHICHTDSIFYPSKNMKIVKIYSESGTLQMYFKYYKTKSIYKSETYLYSSKNNSFIKSESSEIRYRKGNKVFHQTTKGSKIDYTERIKYKKGKYLSSEEKYYDYKKDTLVNITHIKSHKDSALYFYSYTNRQFAKMTVDTTKHDTTFSYTDRNDEYIEYRNDNNQIIATLTFDDKGNLIESTNYIQIGSNKIKKITRAYDLITKTFDEKIIFIIFNEKGLFERAGKTYYKYEYY